MFLETLENNVNTLIYSLQKVFLRVCRFLIFCENFIPRSLRLFSNFVDLSDHYVDSSENYVDLSHNDVDLSDNDVDLSDIKLTSRWMAVSGINRI